MSHQVDDFLKVDGHLGLLNVLAPSRVVDELRDLVQSQLLGALAKHKQHRVDDVGFTAAIGAHHGRKALHERVEMG